MAALHFRNKVANFAPSPQGESKLRFMKAHRYYVYIMASTSGTLYVGVTNSARNRSSQHKGGIGSEFTRKYKVDRLVYYERFQYVSNAIARETQVKGWRRSRKIALIESLNPSWRDLSRDFAKEFTPSEVLIRRNDVALDERFRRDNDRGGDRDSSSLRSSE
jgi:putative endonuclease